MKAPAFDYIRPQSLDHVFSLLAEHGDEARLLAGGQTLLATLNMRLSDPGILIDINGIEALRGIRLTTTGMLHIGALVTHAEIEASLLVATHAPMLSQAAPHVAHRAIRNLGTWGGSIAYADPAAEWPACAVALDAIVIVQGAGGARRLAACDFFRDLYATALAEGEVVVACEIPVLTTGRRHAFAELARRHGDYAIVGLAVAASQDAQGLHDVRLTLFGIGATPIRPRATERFLEGRRINAALLQDAAMQLAGELSDALTPLGDLTNSAAMKRHLASVLLRRTLADLTAQPDNAPVEKTIPMDDGKRMSR